MRTILILCLVLVATRGLAIDRAITVNTNTLVATIAFKLAQDGVLTNHPVTKAQLDASANANALQLYFINTASTNPATYLQLSLTDGDALETNSFVNVTNNMTLTNWVSEVLFIDDLIAGVYELNIHMQNPSPSGDKDVAAQFILFRRTPGGTELNISTTEVSAVTTADDIHYAIHMGVSEDVHMGRTNHLGVRAVSIVTGSGNPPEIDLLTEGTTASRVGVAVSGGNFALVGGDLNQFVGLGGTTGQVFETNGDGTGTWRTQSAASGAVTNIINGGTSGTTGNVSRAGDEVTLTFPAPGGGGGGLTNNGYIHGGWSSYLNATQVEWAADIGFGDGICGGTYFSIAAGFTSTVSTLAAGDDFHYAYLDQSALPTATVYWSTNDPTWSTTYHGWYCPTNSLDRCLDVHYANTNVIGSNINWEGKRQLLEKLRCASAMNPDGAWQTPGDSESSAFLPANAAACYFHIGGQDTSSRVIVRAAPKEWVDAGGSVSRAPFNMQTGDDIWMSGSLRLGPSRNVRIAGENDDENLLYFDVIGWRISR